MDKNVTVKAGLDLPVIGLITFIVFAVLKWGTHSIDWNDFWIWFPLWLPWAIYGAILVICGLIALIYFIVISIGEKR